MSGTTTTINERRQWRTGARTDKGRQRSLNEDALRVLDARGLPVDAAFVVADGMGGMQAGEVASREAVRVIGDVLAQRLADPVADPRDALAEALRRANHTVHALSAGGGGAAEPPTEGKPAESAGAMGTTCVVGVLKNGTLHLAHVGDSRAYLWRGGRLTRLTRDHSFVEERVRAGDLTEDEARRSRFRNMITRAVGIDAEVEPELRDEPLGPEDVVLVCTDGLTTMLPDEAIASLLSGRGADLDETAARLVDAANRKGGADNITVLLLDSAAAGGPPSRRVGSTAPHPEGVVPSPAVVDLDAPPPPRSARGGSRPGASPLVGLLALVGALALLLLTALALSPDVRARARALLSGGPATDQGGGKLVRPVLTPPPTVSAVRDFSKLKYDPPAPFGRFLARGDVLSYSPRGLLYFVAFSSGKVIALSREGEVSRARPAATLPLVPVAPTPVPVSRTFMTTDAQGNVYVSYTALKKVEKRSPDGRVLLTIKDLHRPEALSVDEDGNLYVIDFNEVKVLRARRPGEKSVPPAKPAAGTAAR